MNTSENLHEKSTGSASGCLAWITITAIFLTIVSTIANTCGDNDSSSDSYSDSYPSSLYYVREGTFAATSKQAFDDWGLYDRHNDTQALQRLLLNGQLIYLEQGTEVYLISAKFGYSIVREKGFDQDLWVMTGTIKQKK